MIFLDTELPITYGYASQLEDESSREAIIESLNNRYRLSDYPIFDKAAYFGSLPRHKVYNMY